MDVENMAGENAAGEITRAEENTQNVGTAAQTIEELERQIAELPVGYISRKMIHGKLRFYRQWTENGKIKSQYIKDGQLEPLEEQIAKRRELQQKLKELKNQLTAAAGMGKRCTAERRGMNRYAGYSTNVVVGEALLAMTENIKGESTRQCYEQLVNYLKGEGGDRVCLISGLRRTGKTTMIRQALRDMTLEEIRKAAYIKATAADTMTVLSEDLRLLAQAGYRYVFIDEVTLINDFIDNAALLSDIFAVQGMRVVLTGTDSLAFVLALRQELYDRAVTISTTFVSFREHANLLGLDDVDQYIRYGGTLRAGERSPFGTDYNVDNATFRDADSTKKYIESAVSRNIDRSLASSRDISQFRALRTLQESGDLMEIIDRVMENMNLSYLMLVLTKNPALQNLRLTAWNMKNDRTREEQAAGITRVHVAEIKEALTALDLIVELPAETPQPGSEPIERVIFTQPGMRYSQIQTLMKSLVSGERFSGMSEADKKSMAEKALQEVRVKMLEEIVLLETERALEGRYQVYKLQINAGVFGMIAYNTVENNCFVCELRANEKLVPDQYRRLADADKYVQIEKRFGRITQRFILCDNPQDQPEGDVMFCRVEDYLKNL